MSYEIIKMALESLLSNKTRTTLSILGIIIGVSTVIAVFGIGKGAEQSVNEQFQGLSANSLIIMSSRSRDATSSSKLQSSDVEVIMEGTEHISGATALVTGNASASFGSESLNLGISGIDTDYFDVAGYELSQGRSFSEEEVEDRTKIAILGSGAVDSLFLDGENPLGETITIKGKSYEVVGVLGEIGSSFGPSSPDDSIFAPYTTVESSILGSSATIILNLTIDDINNVEIAQEEVVAALRDAHNLKDSQENDFRVMDAGSMVGAAQESAALMTSLLTVVAAITLLVSGIGIMNVMFVTVAERTKEIGIAKAIGGKQSDILSQFLLESVILSMIGGLLGIILGLVALMVIDRLGLIMIASTLIGPVIGFSFSVVVGVFFGFYPAYQASRMDPVDALRSE